MAYNDHSNNGVVARTHNTEVGGISTIKMRYLGSYFLELNRRTVGIRMWQAGQVCRVHVRIQKQDTVSHMDQSSSGILNKKQISLIKGDQNGQNEESCRLRVDLVISLGKCNLPAMDGISKCNFFNIQFVMDSCREITGMHMGFTMVLN